jgi:hypothetical protein
MNTRKDVKKLATFAKSFCPNSGDLGRASCTVSGHGFVKASGKVSQRLCLSQDNSRHNRDCQVSAILKSLPPVDHQLGSHQIQRLCQGNTAVRRRMSVYQISQYPSSDKRFETALTSQSDGAKTSNARGKESLQPGGGGATRAGKIRATIAARLISSECVGSSSAADFPSRINDRTGSNCGSPFTCSSERTRYLPASMSSTQLRTGSFPSNQGIRSEKCLGNVTRFEVSVVVWTGVMNSVLIAARTQFTQFYQQSKRHQSIVFNNFGV